MQHQDKAFRYRMTFLGNYRPRKRGKTVWIVRVEAHVLRKSVQKLNLNTSSSLKMQDFEKQVRDNPEFSKIHGREFPIPRLLCRNTRKKWPDKQELISQNSSSGTRVHEKKASVPKPESGCNRPPTSVIKSTKSNKRRQAPLSPSLSPHLCSNAKKNLFNLSFPITWIGLIWLGEAPSMIFMSLYNA